MTTPDESAIRWRKSTRSDQSNCVEIALSDGGVLVRDSKDPAGVRLQLSRTEWLAFVRAVRDDRFLPW